MHKRLVLWVMAVTAGATLVGVAGGYAAPAHRPDLADAVAGSYGGDVISDSQGSSKQDVSLTLTRVGPNTVQITSDYARLPVVRVSLEGAMGHIVNRNGDTAFAYDPTKTPKRLDVSFHNEVSWSGSPR